MKEILRLLSRYLVPCLVFSVLLLVFPDFFFSIENNSSLRKFISGLPPETDIYSRWLGESDLWDGLPIDPRPDQEEGIDIAIRISLPDEGSLCCEFSGSGRDGILLRIGSFPGGRRDEGIVKNGEGQLLEVPVMGEYLDFHAGIVRDSLTVSRGSYQRTVRLTESLTGLRFSLLNSSGDVLLVEKLQINGRDSLRDLPEPGILLHVPELLGLGFGSSGSFLAGFLFLALVLMLIDQAVMLFLRRFTGRMFSEKETGYLLQPLRLLSLFAACKALGLPVSAFLCFAVWLIVVESIGVLLSPVKCAALPGRNTIPGKLPFTVAILFYLALSYPAVVILVNEHSYRPVGAVFTAILPLFLLGSTVPSGTSLNSRRFLTSLAQAPLYLFIRFHYSGILEYPVFLLLLFLPWAFLLITGIIHERKPGARGYELARVILASSLFFLFFETFLATSDFTNKLFSFGAKDPWDYERYTNILGQFDSAERLKNVEWILGYSGGMLPVVEQEPDTAPDPLTDPKPAPARIHTKKKREGVYRIICLGSSSTAGVGASKPEYTYPAGLASILDERTNLDLEVITAGLPGATFCVLSVYLEEVLLLLEPDLVIVYFGHNGDEPGLRAHWERLKSIAPDAENFRDLRLRARFRTRNPPLLWMFDRLVSFRSFNLLLEQTDYLSRQLSLLIAGPGRESEYARVVEEEPNRVAELCTEAGAKVVFMPEIETSAIMRTAPLHEYHRLFSEVERRHGRKDVYCLDPVEAFRNRMVAGPDIPPGASYSENPDDLLMKEYFLDAMHLYDIGYRILAELIAEFLLEEKIVPVNLSSREECSTYARPAE